MRIIDLDYGELLHQFVVDLELLLLELGDDLLAQVDGQDRDDRVEVLELFLCVFNRGLQAASVLLVLEKRANCLLSLVYVLQVGLRVGLLGLSLLKQLLKVLLLCYRVHYSLDVVYLALAPVVHVVEGVLLVVDHVLHLLLDLAALGVIEDEELLLSFGIVRHVEVLVLVDEGLEHAVVADALEASLAELAQILLHALHLKEHLLGKDRELSHYIVKTLLVSEVIVALLHIGDLA